MLTLRVEIDLLDPPCRCKGASHYGLSADRKRRSQEGECTDSTSELTIATLPNDSPNSATVALLSDDPGLVNPAFDPSMEDHNSQSGSTTSLAARSSSKKSECECADGCLCVLTSYVLGRTASAKHLFILKYSLFPLMVFDRNPFDYLAPLQCFYTNPYN